jgi:hypothetical protein
MTTIFLIIKNITRRDVAGSTSTLSGVEMCATEHLLDWTTVQRRIESDWERSKNKWS